MSPMEAEGSGYNFDVGNVKRVRIRPTKMETVRLGFFRDGEKPRITIRRYHVDPKGSLVCHTARLDEQDSYEKVYLFQNFGVRTVLVTLRRVS